MKDSIFLGLSFRKIQRSFLKDVPRRVKLNIAAFYFQNDRCFGFSFYPTKKQDSGHFGDVVIVRLCTFVWGKGPRDWARSKSKSWDAEL